MAAKWTQEEEALITSMRVEGHTIREIAAKLRSRSESSIRMRLNKLGIIRSPTWTQEEKDLFNELKTKGHTNAYIAKALGRTLSAVKTYCSIHWHNSIPGKNSA